MKCLYSLIIFFSVTVLLMISCDNNSAKVRYVYQIDLKEVIIDLSGNSQDSIFLESLEEALKIQDTTDVSLITLFGIAYREKNGNDLPSIFSDADVLNIKVGFSDADVLNSLHKYKDELIDNSLITIKNRMDNFGKKGVEIIRFENTDRMAVVMSESNTANIRKVIESGGNLGFWEIYENVVILDDINSLNDRLKEVSDENRNEKEDLSVQGSEEGLIEIDEDFFNEQMEEEDFGPLFNLLHPNFPRSNADRSATIGYAKEANMDSIMQLLGGPMAKEVFTSYWDSLQFVWKNRGFEARDGEKYYELFAINTKTRKIAEINSENISDAYATENPAGPGFTVSLSMDEQGARLWEKMTRKNVGRQIAVVLDDKVYSAPNVNEAIPNGNTSISGGFHEVQSAKELATVLSGGMLSHPLILIEKSIQK